MIYISPQLFAAMLGGAAAAIVLYILLRKHAIFLCAALSVACVPICWFGSFLFPISSNGAMLVIQAIILSIIAAVSFGTYYKTLKWTNATSNHYKIVILLLLATVINFAAIGFEKPVKKPSFIQEFIAWFKPVSLSKEKSDKGFKIDIECKSQKECQNALVKMQLELASEGK